MDRLKFLKNILKKQVIGGETCRTAVMGLTMKSAVQRSPEWHSENISGKQRRGGLWSFVNKEEAKVGLENGQELPHFLEMRGLF